MVGYQEGVTLPVPVMLHLYETYERVALARRATATSDQSAVSGSHSKEHFEAVQQRIAVLEKLAAGEPPPGYTGDTPERTEL